MRKLWFAGLLAAALAGGAAPAAAQQTPQPGAMS